MEPLLLRSVHPFDGGVVAESSLDFFQQRRPIVEAKGCGRGGVAEAQ